MAATMYSEVLGKDIDQSTIDCGRTGNESIAEIVLLLHTEVVATVQLEHVIFLEAIFVHKHVNALPSSIFATGVLLLDGTFVVGADHRRAAFLVRGDLPGCGVRI